MIAEILFEAAWKSLVVAPCLVALLIMMKRQAPADRVAVGGLGFAALTLLPAVVVGLAALPVTPIAVAAPAAASVVMPAAVDPATLAAYASAEPAPAAAWPMSAAQLFLLAWAIGSVLILARLLAGLATLRRWTARAERLDTREWRDMLMRCGIGDDVSLRLSNDVAAPLSWGWREPVILIDRETMASRAESEAVIAHEAAHLAHGDWPRLVAIRVVVAIFWFNPFVWLLERQYLQDVEEAADAEATNMVEPAHYAQVLLNVARNAAVPVGANSISSGSLAKRIRVVLSGRQRSRWARVWRIGALTSVAAVAGPIALVQFVAPAVSAAAEPMFAPRAGLVAPPRQPQAPALLPPSSVRGPAATGVASPVAPVAIPSMAVAPTDLAAPVAAIAAAQTAAVAPTPDVIDREEIERIKRASEEIRVQSQIIARDSQKIAERARATAAAAMANAKRDMLRGADDMERGAVEMRSGAAKMREEARKLRDPAYRAEVIAEAKANRGRYSGKWNYSVPTDQELIDAIPKMEDGARKMDDGVEKMREGARKMRESAQRQD